MEENMEELKAVVTQTLDSKGVLGKIRAMLRASVFEALDEQERSSGNTAVGFASPFAGKILETPEGRVVGDLLREYMEFYKLDHTLGVLLPEAQMPAAYVGRDELAKSIGLTSDEADGRSLLVALVSRLTRGGAGEGGEAAAAARPRPASSDTNRSRATTPSDVAKGMTRGEEVLAAQKQTKADTEPQVERAPSEEDLLATVRHRPAAGRTADDEPGAKLPSKLEPLRGPMPAVRPGKLEPVAAAASPSADNGASRLPAFSSHHPLLDAPSNPSSQPSRGSPTNDDDEDSPEEDLDRLRAIEEQLKSLSDDPNPQAAKPPSSLGALPSLAQPAAPRVPLVMHDESISGDEIEDDISEEIEVYDSTGSAPNSPKQSRRRNPLGADSTVSGLSFSDRSAEDSNVLDDYDHVEDALLQSQGEPFGS